MSRSAGALPPLGLAGRLLLWLSDSPRPEGGPDGPEDVDPLADLHDVFPDLEDRVRGRNVLDFGCGTGRQAVALAGLGARTVIGIDIQEELLSIAREHARSSEVTDRVSFIHADELRSGRLFDVVLSKDSMEHFSEPLEVLRQIRGYLRPEGRVLVTFCPTWLSPYGAHMHYFTRLPWVHLLFSERTVMAVRSRYRDDGAGRYEDVPGGLNRMTVRRFHDVVTRAGFAMVEERIDYVKGISVAAAIPGLRELLANRVTAVLSRPAPPQSDSDPRGGVNTLSLRSRRRCGFRARRAR